VIDYDREAASYDDTRGGPERAAAVASAVARLLNGGLLNGGLLNGGVLGGGVLGGGVLGGGVLVDVACGTGIVTSLLKGGAAPGDGSPSRDGAGGSTHTGVAGGPGSDGERGRTVFGVDRSPGMLAVAARRLDGHVLLGDATRLPLASASVDAVLMVWLLHLLPASEPALAEAVRVLKPGGRFITTVGKSAAYFVAPSDVASATERWRHDADATDRFDRVAGFLRQAGLHPVGEATFPGIGQGRSPRQWRDLVRAGRLSWARDDPGGVDRALAGLPDQERARPEPVYRLVAFTASVS
jgi:SAM-dependent methyltransferase